MVTEGKLHCRERTLAYSHPHVERGRTRNRSFIRTARDAAALLHGNFVRFFNSAPLRAGDGACAFLHLEAFAQIELATDGIVDEEILSAFALDAPVVNQVRAIHDGESLPHVVISDHYGQP